MTISLTELVATAKNRWRVERSHEDLKGQLGLDHYEGRSFVGWHHHVTVALVCYAFLVAEKARLFFPRGRQVVSAQFARVRGLSVTSTTP